MRPPKLSIEEFHRQYGIATDSDHKAYRARYAAGKILLQLRLRVESEGDNWWEWYDSQSVRSRKNAIRCIAIAVSHNGVESDCQEAWMACPDDADIKAEVARLQRHSGFRTWSPEMKVRRRDQTRERVRRFRGRQKSLAD